MTDEIYFKEKQLGQIFFIGLPGKTKFQLAIVLAWLAALAISMVTQSWLIFGIIVGISILVLLLLFSGDITLEHPGQKPPVNYDEQFFDPRDGGALYDDVWGGV